MPTNSNHQAAIALKSLGYPPAKIRQGLLKVSGKSQVEIAKTLGVSRQTINLHVTGIRRNPDIVHGISNMLGVPTAILFPDVASWLQLPDFSL